MSIGEQKVPTNMESKKKHELLLKNLEKIYNKLGKKLPNITASFYTNESVKNGKRRHKQIEVHQN